MIRFSLVRKQLGFSLLELLVVMIIGVFIMMGITTVYVGNKTTSMTTDELSLLQANGRDVLQQLTEVIQHTGYKSTRSPLDSEMFILGTVVNHRCSGGGDSIANPSLLGAVQNNTANGDTIGVVYLGDDLLTTDCTGSVISTDCRLSHTSASPIAASRIYNYFKADVNAQGNPVLTCGGSLSVV